MPFLRKYNTLTVTGTTAIRIPIIKRAVVDFAVSADWTPAAGDVKIAIDGAAAANVTNLPTAVAMGNTAYWEFILTAAELTCKSCVVTVADSSTKAVEDQAFIVETFGHASAMYQPDLSAANVSQTGDSYAVVNGGTSGNAALKTLIDTLTTYVDTEVGAIKAKTDNLPSDPADASDIAASFATVASTLATIAAYVDTEVAAIKAKTDNLPSDPADASDIAASFATVASTLATIAAYVDTEVAAIKAKTDNLPSDPADASDIAASFAIIAAYIDTEVAAIKVVTDRLNTGLVLDGAVYQWTANALELAPAGGGGGGGGLTVDQAAQLTRVESQTAKLSGTPVTVNGNVKPGGQIVLHHGDNHTVALGNPVIVGVDDVGGSLHTLMAAIGVGNLSIAAIRGADAASRIVGTVAALNYASNILSVTLEFTAVESAKGIVGPAYNYDVIRTDTPTRTYFSGRLTVVRDAR